MGSLPQKVMHTFLDSETFSIFLRCQSNSMNYVNFRNIHLGYTNKAMLTTIIATMIWGSNLVFVPISLFQENALNLPGIPWGSNAGPDFVSGSAFLPFLFH